MKKLFSVLVLIIPIISISQINPKLFESELNVRNYLDNHKLDPVEGIYNYGASPNEITYKVAVIKKDFKYFGYIIESSNEKWTPGRIKFRLDETAYENKFAMYWVMSRGKNQKMTPAIYKQGVIKFKLERISFLNKVYPKLSTEIKKQKPNEKPPTDSTELIIDSLRWRGNGSGIFISKNGYIITNYHVIKKAKVIEVNMNNSTELKSYKAILIKSDEINDLAILKIKDSSFKELKNLPYNFKTEIVDVGTEVFALGYPMALSIMGKAIKFTDGKISSKTGYLDDVTTYQTTTPIQPGNSGGPLFDYNGNLIGINSSGLAYEIADNVSYSIKTTYVRNLIDILPEKVYLPNDKSLDNENLTEIIKVLSNYVVLIKVK
tara:strand:- start:2243 stop:3373 length:1131 start_codon:yes stop_codon:yes gene_type:complete